VQFYADHSEREDISFSETRDTVDLEFQQRFDASTSQELVWGAGYRYTSDDMEETFEIAFDPGERGVSLFSAFIQDEISLGDGRARITLGSKFEHNDYTGLEVQPNVRAVWKLGADNRLWAAISRAVRSPSRIFHDVSAAQLAFPDPMGGGATLLARVEGNSDYESEDLLAFELGYRVRPTDSVYVDVAAFFNDYSDVTTIEQAGAPFLVMTPIPHVVVPMEFANEAEAESFGFEITANWRASPRVNFFGSYGYLDLELDLPPASAATFDTPEESPEHQAHLRGAFDLNGGVSLDVALFYVDELEVGVPGQALGGGTIPNDDYVRLDVRLGWQPRESFEAFLVLQNLQDEQHPEFGGDLVVPTEFERSIHGGIRWSF
jgi:iron complex outermembrane receptor protein